MHAARSTEPAPRLDRLRRVDPDQPHVLDRSADLRFERVAVDDTGDLGAGGLRLGPAGAEISFPRSQEEESDDSEQKHAA